MASIRKRDVRREGPEVCSAGFACLFGFLVVSALLASCGGSGGSGPTQGSSPSPTPDFSLSVTPTNLSIQTGTSAQASLEASASNGFASQVSVGLTGLPAGVTASPSTITLTPRTPQQVTFSASSSSSVSNATVTFTGTSGSLAHTAQLGLAVIQPITSNTPPFRMRYVRTGASTLYFTWPNSSWIIYNPPTNRFFVTDPEGNHIYAIDAKTETVIGSIVVPGAYGIDDTPDHSTLYVGTQIGDVYAINPVTMTVTKRYLASQIGPNGFHAYSVRVMADGRLALLGGQGGIPNVDGYADFAIWNPADNSISIYASQYGAIYAGLSSGAYTQVCGPLLNIGKFARSPDRTKILVASIDSDGTLCEVDESTGSNIYAQPSGNDAIFNFAQSPDGNLIALPYGPNGTNEAAVLDAHTLAQVNLFSVNGDTSSGDDFMIGPNSQTLYTSSDSTVYAYNLATGQQVGWLPNIFVPPFFIGSALGVSPANNPDFQAMDGTGLIAGPMEEGVGFLDTSKMQTGPVGMQFANSYLTPATGSVDGGTSTTWPVSTEQQDYPQPQNANVGAALAGTITGVYFGSQQGSSASTSTTSGAISATTPPGAPGPASVYALGSHGGVDYVPEGFSYGPTILEVTPNEATAGGGTGNIYGYGFGPLLLSSSSVPSGVVVTIGGKKAAVTAFNPNAYGVLSPPFGLQALTYAIPSGTANTKVDVTVSSSSGTATVHDGMTYLPAIQKYPLSGSSLAEGVYDPTTDLYYFTDATEIRVFSKTDGQWLPPITLPTADNPQRLWGIAVSPDGNELAVADVQGQAIYVISTANPSSVQKFPIPQLASGVVTNPVGVAISDTGIVYFSASNYGGTGYSGSFKLDTSSGSVASYGVDGPGMTSDIYLRTAFSPANSRVYFNDDGEVFSVDTGTGNISYEPTEPGCCYGDDDLALSSDQTRLAATGYFYDSSLNAESYEGLNLREQMNISYLYGEKLSPDGHLLFQPTSLGIDVLDGRVGTLMDRIALPVALSPNYDALVSDGTDNDLIAITGANGDGIAVIDLTSISDPSPLPYNSTVRFTTRFAGLKSPPSTRQYKISRKSRTHSQPQPAGWRVIPHKTAQKLLLRLR